ncbi:MAG: hypothetical protein A2821_03585 [Candidatus Magasanikbacteria bacterium RIFCSPHIGHO2_01_FULL_41_23]|uniref:Uncharacterized protein n=1 Tax=Candidatus Magasanikbacteria bacterium RIFCSPLOWO2_01_FULL_40_15 TaxID=1798686 RepID=A0A1F6N1J7_9BACT|nr:MAG: hypothetical protein A2821_03585 [Candidatus Magasanikbacteria bacterium RIFCSPHIGHO2_01_FULL_41_23]OGH67240.1 MAG: hypothetical protein A3C66_00660 [Candidatus Magasanikbacteria bacterium RIFCSPHIGHO2_02_FULL_41_35]OGH76643.1 MAG: hypothetical protein A3F22_03660 [Candidatus Magasanikbacteria bacterium RIFCSPHIGHO2_12_FULL_41_16]OGH77807.1 MAG: hypothetical protein A2983_00210 [Candidatus Magasanikbacteria bacterium RIFCSPLOWO2_01_FULL_40_15]
MFFKRRTPVESQSPSSSEIITIPEVFYAGNDPEVQSGVHKNNASHKSKEMDSIGDSSPHTRLIASGMITIFVLVLGAAAWYFADYLGFDIFKKNQQPKNKITAEPANTASSIPTVPIIPATSTATEIIIDTVSTSTTIPIEIETTITTPVPTTSVALPVRQVALEFPPIIQIDASDSDADGLTDDEEELFGTDSAIFDTDNDNYYDGQEVANLYNPKAVAPLQLIDSGLVKELVQTRDVYRLYYPLAWSVGVVDPEGNNMLITADNGDYIEFRISPKNNNEDFTTWFAREASTERITDLQPALNKFGVSYWHRKDDLAFYVDNPNFVLVILYHPESNAPIAFRHVIQMMLTSLRLQDSSNSATTTAL